MNDDTADLPNINTNPYSWSSSLDSEAPLLTSDYCAQALGAFFQDSSALAVATEASSHPGGLESLYAQPWVYAGGGLGNMDECPLQNCLAGAGTRRDSLTFGSVCMVPECSAYDLAAQDFFATIERTAQGAVNSEVALEYLTLNSRIAKLNTFLGTGWTCGNFLVPWSFWPFGLPYILTMLLTAVLAVVGTMKKRAMRLHTVVPDTNENTDVNVNVDADADADITAETEVTGLLENNGFQEEKKQEYYPGKHQHQHQHQHSVGMAAWKPAHSQIEAPISVSAPAPITRLWSAFDVSAHLERITSQPCTETACLDGLRVGSLLWIVLGHVMAIMSSSGAGYINPANVLPPTGLTTTIPGQAIFSSRLAVDTFLCISGFLVVHVLLRKMPLGNSNNNNSNNSAIWRYVTTLPSLLLNRVVRILPLYVCTLGFYTQIAPHLGNGPFWYQWLSLLKPCHDYGWSNFLFVNNFFPWNLSMTQTCFYHSWYLAVDMQLFSVAPLLVFVYQSDAARGRRLTLAMWALSVLVTVYLSYTRDWSINTFDGAAVARFEVEAYAKPHIRAQSYLVGMYVAMILPARVLKQRSPWTRTHVVAMLIALGCMSLVAFGTSGAYARRPCQYKEWPELDECGSLWSPSLTFWYTALSRTVWTVGIGVVMHLCLGRSHGGNLVSSMLSWKCWTPLSQLSFGGKSLDQTNSLPKPPHP
jgi:peptidoglycan/LPS O-acetylase OafA/YrhL